MKVQQELGKIGEDMAVEWLRNKGYSIMERNFRFGKAEIDILAEKEGILAVVEVKMRRRGYLGVLADAVSLKQRNRIIRAADHYVLANDLDVEVRFDVILLLHENQKFNLEHLKAAFSHYHQ
ncbi:endonuclease [Muriicola soli]|uniref:UPF0102 protein EQY75_00460 n=2 Tax=Muriicola soli TaxID=2507538 RepID=A0A411ED26_9FLAO|nr:endonuclease [Muriicola soli]